MSDSDESLDRALSQGGAETVALFQGMPEKQRRGLAPRAIDWYRRSDYGQDVGGIPWRTLAETAPLAVMASGSFSEIKKLRCAPRFDDLLLELLKDRKPSWLQKWADWRLERWPMHWYGIRQMMAEGLIERPQTPAYLLGIIGGRHGVSVLDTLRSDSALLAEIPALFETDGTSEFSLAGHDKYMAAEHGWGNALRVLCREGHLLRERLLDWSLEALGRGYPSFRSGWYARFFLSLEPTPAELASRQQKLASLLTSEISTTVAFALKWWSKTLKSQPLADEALLAALEPVWSSDKKGQIRSALKLLDTTQPGSLWVEPLLQAVLHPDPAIQAEVSERLHSAYPVPEAKWRDRCLDLLEALAPSTQAVWSAWLGEEVSSGQVSEAAPCPHEELTPLSSHQEVCDLAAQMLEEIDGIRVELLLDGMLRFRQADSPSYPALAKRSRTRLREYDLRGPLAALVLAWMGEESPWAEHWSWEDELSGFLASRLRELHQRLQSSQEGKLLSLPPDSSGILPLELLLGRLAEGVEVRDWDFAQAILRLPPEVEAGELPTGLPGDCLRFALGQVGSVPEVPELWVKAAHEFRARREGDEWFLSTEVREIESYDKIYRVLHVNPGEPGPEEHLLCWKTMDMQPGTRRWLSKLCPARRQRWFYQGALRLVANLDWWGAEWADRVFLDNLFEPEPWGHWGRVVAAFGLGCKESTQRGLAVDAVAEALVGGRLSGAELGEALRLTAATGAIKANRWSKSFSELRSFAPVEPLMEALERLLGPPPEAFKPNPLLSAFYEIACSGEGGVRSEPCRVWLASLKGKSRATQTAKQILKL